MMAIFAWFGVPDKYRHRVLFLSALVLLLFTFIMNTLAELIRQRLRKKYSSL